MKTIITVFILSISSIQCLAMGDIDRIILAGANAASGGTFLPEMEAEIQKMKMDYAKKTAEFNLELEKERRSNLRDLIDSQIKILTSFQTTDEAHLTKIQNQKTTFMEIVKLTEDLYSSSVSLDDVQTELVIMAETFPDIDASWKDLLAQANISPETKALDAETVKNLLMQAYDMSSEFERLENLYISQVDSFKSEILTLQKSEDGLK